MKFDIKATIEEAHKTLTVWFAYLVAGSITLQECWSQMDDYVPPKWRHWIIGAATLLVVLDKLRRSKVAKDPQP